MKKSINLSCSALRLLVALLAACGLASANSIIVPTGVDPNRGGSIWRSEDGEDTRASFAGVIFISLTENGHQYARDTLCVDLFTDIYLGVSYNTTVLRPRQAPGKSLTRVSGLVDNAAIQFADWDIVHDQGGGF
jgi:hypothetical protein